MKIAVVTPYHAEDVAELAACVRSVADQELAPHDEIERVLVADGGDTLRGVEAARIARRRAPMPKMISLPVAHADYGNGARAVGALDAVARGFDAVAFLDADNWYAGDHVASLIAAHRLSGASVLSSGRAICRVDGSVLFPHDQESDGVHHVDTNCLMLTRQAFPLLPIWAFIPPELAVVGDRVFWAIVQRSAVDHKHTGKPTINYRTRYAVHYRAKGETPPATAKENPPAPAGSTRIDMFTWLRPTFAPGRPPAAGLP